MTRQEWLRRCKMRYVERLGVEPNVAHEMARDCFNAQEREFSECVDYSPESCADEDIDFWGGKASGWQAYYRHKARMSH